MHLKFKKVTDGLMKDYLEGNTSVVALDSFQIGNNLRRLKKLMLKFVAEKKFNFDLVPHVEKLNVKIRGIGLDEKLKNIREYVQMIGGGVEFIGHLSKTFSVKFNAPTNPPPPQDPVSWYATWFNAQWVSSPVGVADRFNVSSETWFSKMRFEKHDYSVMERTAHISYLIQDYVETLLHAIGIGWRPRVSNILQVILQGLKGTLTWGMGDSTDEGWVNAYKWLGAGWFDYSISTLFTWFFSWFENPLKLNGTNFVSFLQRFAFDWGEYNFYLNYAHLARELVLCSMTLENTNSDNVGTTENHEKVLGLANLFGDVGIWIGATFTGRDEYGFADGAIMGYWGLSFLTSMTLPLFALIITRVKSGSSPRAAMYGHILGQGFLMGATKWWMYQFIMWDGSTDDGRYGGFTGYPNRETSPYLLPYPAGVEHGCVQGNLGLVSHNTPGNQVYSFDYTHDFRDWVCAVRAGVVTNIRDNIQDRDRRFRANRVEIQHTGFLVPGHDVRQRGEDIRTTAQYLHGSYFGARHAFALYGIPFNFIRQSGNRPAAPVRQGQIVMLAADTGNSAFNHLHINLTAAGARTLPWVYRNVEGDGVCRSNRFYTSANPLEPIRATPTNPIYHPDKANGNASAATANTITLRNLTSGAQNASSPIGNWYEGSFILVTWTTPGGVQRNNIRRITAYNGETFVATVDRDWDEIPTGATINYRIGSGNRARQDPDPGPAFNHEKSFAFWGPYNFPPTNREVYDAARAAATFPDGGRVYRWARVARFSREIRGDVQNHTGNTVTLENVPETDIPPADMTNRFIVIVRGGNIVAYKSITAYDRGNRRATVNSSWGFALTINDDYRIGGKSFGNATADERRQNSFYTPDTNPATNSPTNFADASPPVTYLTYHINWPI
ncbi:MAG: hypothetical protein AAF570_07655 [Bacteroidota bacterium]